MSRVSYINDDGYKSSAYTNGDAARALVALRYIADAYPGEPLLCIRGRDRLAIPTVEDYLTHVRNAKGIVGPVEQAVMRDLSALRLWQAANPRLLKYPDRPDGYGSEAA